MFKPAREADPDMAVLEIGVEQVKAKIEQVEAADIDDAGTGKNKIGEKRADSVDKYAREAIADHRIKRMNPIGGNRGQHLCTVMNRMKRPQHPDAMNKPVP